MADSAKQMATPKKNVEKTAISAAEAESYLGFSALYTGIGRTKNSTDPKRCENIFTWYQISCAVELHVVIAHLFRCGFRRRFLTIFDKTGIPIFRAVALAF